MATMCKILHPKSGESTYSLNFAAFGVAERSVTNKMIGTITDKNGKVVAKGVCTYLERSKKHHDVPEERFWILYFEVPAGSAGNYTLHIYDQDGQGGQELGDPSTNIVIPEKGEFDEVQITYPKPNTTVPLEFVAYGTADVDGGNITGIMSNCIQAESTYTWPATPALPKWNLYCALSPTTSSAVGTLSVSQGGGLPTTVGSLTIG